MTIELLDAATANIIGSVNDMAQGPMMIAAYDKIIISGITNATVKIYGGVESGNLQLLGGGTITADGAYDCSVFSYMRADVEDYISHSGSGIKVEVGV